MHVDLRMCAFVHANMLVCARACTDARLLHLPVPHVAQPRRKTPILSDQKEKQTFWMKVLWSSVGPFIFFGNYYL